MSNSWQNILKALKNAVGTPRVPTSKPVGEVIARLPNITFASIDGIQTADWSKYSTCRGRMSKDKLTRIIDILVSDTGRYSQDERADEANDGIWDWVCHQYTFYSVTPLFLDYLLGFHRDARIENGDLRKFVEICRRNGTGSIFLSKSEITQNRNGSLPIYRIEDVLLKHRRTNDALS